jgi:hypothetical protein
VQGGIAVNASVVDDDVQLAEALDCRTDQLVGRARRDQVADMSDATDFRSDSLRHIAIDVADHNSCAVRGQLTSRRLPDSPA